MNVTLKNTHFDIKLFSPKKKAELAIKQNILYIVPEAVVVANVSVCCISACLPFYCWSRGNESHTLSRPHLRSQKWQNQSLGDTKNTLVTLLLSVKKSGESRARLTNTNTFDCAQASLRWKNQSILTALNISGLIIRLNTFVQVSILLARKIETIIGWMTCGQE